MVPARLNAVRTGIVNRETFDIYNPGKCCPVAAYKRLYPHICGYKRLYEKR
jgi:hypothetical protein